jgi:DNA-binding CsgD family transcriptional regulator
MLDMLAWLRGMYRGDLEKGMRCAREGLEIAERAGDPHLLMITESSLALLGVLSGEPHPERLAHAVALERDQVEGGPSEGPLAISGKIRFWEGNIPEARQSFEEALATAARSGNELTRPYRLYDLSLLACAEGDLEASVELARLGIEAAEDAEFPIGSLQYPLASAQAWLGEAEASRSTAGVLLEWAARRGERPAIVRAHMVLGLLSLSEGGATLAADHLRRAAGMIDDMGVEQPGAFPVLPDAIEAEARAGETERAEALLARLERQVSRTEGAWAAAALDRSRGTVRLALGDPDAAIGPLEAAEGMFSRLGYRPDAARALLLLGNAALRAGHRTRAADALAQAGERSAAMGASLWEERAMAELERVAPRAGAELTATERRVVGLVVEGMKNKEIAGALFVSVATVEAHLTRTYRKLGIRSRNELVRLVSEGSVDLTPPQAASGTP